MKPETETRTAPYPGALTSALQRGDTEALSALVARFGVAVLDRQRRDGLNAAGIAIKAGQASALACVLRLAGTERVLDTDPRLLIGAAQTGNAQCLRVVLGALPPSASLGGHGAEAALRAAANGHAECLDLLLSRGVDADARAAGGESLLHLCAGGGHLECLRLALSYAACLDARDLHQRTALRCAVGANHLDCARVLAAHGADLEAIDSEGQSPLVFACLHRRTEACALLLELGADPNARCPMGRTPLYWAVTAGPAPIVRELLVHGADVAQAGAHGASIDQIAERGQADPSTRALLRAAVRESELRRPRTVAAPPHDDEPTL